jgi:hypothetical protein
MGEATEALPAERDDTTPIDRTFGLISCVILEDL